MQSQGQQIEASQQGQGAGVEESRELLLSYRDRFTSSLRYNIDRAERIEALMMRRSANRWGVGKKQQMVRRLVNAKTAAKQLEAILDQVEVRLQQVGDA